MKLALYISTLVCVIVGEFVFLIDRKNAAIVCYSVAVGFAALLAYYY